ncbi:Protein ACTIVITY OF BC1 COMPLEX KINASE 3 [Chlorella vulgaris]
MITATHAALGWPCFAAPKRASRRSQPIGAVAPYAPFPALPPSPEGGTELVVRQSAPPALSFPTLPAPQLVSLSDAIDARATQAHWGSNALREALSLKPASELFQSVQSPRVAQLTQLLDEMQATLQDGVRQLSLLAEGGAQQLGGDEVSTLRQLVNQLEQVSAAAREAASSSFSSQGGFLSNSGGSTTPANGQPAAQLELPSSYAGYSLQTLALVTAGVAALIALSVPRDDGPGGSGGGGTGGSGAKPMGSASNIGGSGNYLPTTWDVAAVSSYYGQRPTLVAQRMLQVTSAAVGYGTALLADMASGSVERNRWQRADQAMAAIEQLGPAFVKVAQALSTRVDLLAPEYLVAIQRLQDRVPPFPDALAYACIERSFGQPLGQVFSQLSSTAVAAASLGQVYRGTLRSSGREVAIKVRRPDVLESVTLDLYLMRGLAQRLADVPQVKSDWVGIIDAWAARFLDEMNYTLEAANTRQFAADLAALPGVVIPDVIDQGTSEGVLVTSWIEGERLSESSAGDVRELCDTLLSAYLIQLLDTGLLHADPHPGNLLRTSDGRIAILDHGLIQEVPADYSLALLEYIAHLSVGDWDSLADDLVALGFVDSIQDKGKLVGPLGIILTELSAGGGAKKVNIAVVMEEIDRLSQQFEFKVPPYFALILRTFSVIEGIALQSDPNYSIVRECFPYIAKRLLTDDNPRAREALRQLLFAGGTTVSLGRVEKLVQGLGNFTVDGLAPSATTTARVTAGTQQQRQQQQQAPPPFLDSTAKEVLGAVFSQRPTYVQELLVEQAVNTADAAGRQLAAFLLAPVLGNLAAAQPALQSNGQMGDALASPAMLPSLVQLSPQDQEQLQTAQGITNLLLQNTTPQAQLTPQQAQQLARELLPLLPQLLPGIAATGQLFAQQLGQRAYNRLAVVAGTTERRDEYSALD